MEDSRKLQFKRVMENVINLLNVSKFSWSTVYLKFFSPSIEELDDAEVF